jgi:ElaB/YqjD/DUF883 family membrane-anchored ribosome-binding protein
MSDNYTYENQGGQIQESAEKVAEDASDIQAQLKKLREDMGALAATVTSIAKEKAANYGAQVASDAIDATEGLREDYVSFEQAVTDRIRARPLQAIGLAAGIGYLIAAMRRH